MVTHIVTHIVSTNSDTFSLNVAKNKMSMKKLKTN